MTYLPSPAYVIHTLRARPKRREAAFDGLELEPSFEHDDGSWLAVVAGPAAKARETQLAKASEPFGWGFFSRWVRPSIEAPIASISGMSSGEKASRAAAGRSSGRRMRRLRVLGSSARGPGERGQLLDDGGCHQRGGDQVLERALVRDGQRLNVEALRLHRPEQLLDAQRRRYRSAMPAASAAVPTSSVVSSRQCTGSTPAGSISRTSTTCSVSSAGSAVFSRCSSAA